MVHLSKDKNISQSKGNSDTNIYKNSDLDTKHYTYSGITTKLDELIKNHLTTNETLLTLRIRELKKTLKEKDGIVQNLEIKIDILEQNEKKIDYFSI